MEETSKKLVSAYFSHFYKHSNTWQSIIDKAGKPLSGLKNQAEQLSHVEKVNVRTEFSEFPGLKDNLLFKILSGISEELSNLRNIINEFNSAIQELGNKLNALDKNSCSVDWADEAVLIGSVTQPSLSDLAQLAYEGWSIYNEMYQNISNAFKSLNIRSESSLNQLQLSFRLKEDQWNRIQFIIAITQYCYTA